EYAKYDRVLDQSFACYLTEKVFDPLLDAIRCGDIEEATVILEAEPHDKIENVWRLIFGTIQIQHSSVPATKQSPLPNTALKRLESLLYAIFIALVLILIELWRR